MLLNTLEKIRRHGLGGTTRIVLQKIKNRTGYTRWRVRNAPVYASPTPTEWQLIENDLTALGVPIEDFSPSAEAFLDFQQQAMFPADYHGGQSGGVWDEKLLEHWISSELLNLMNFSSKDIFVDIAAARSPWAQALREKKSINAFAIDMSEVGSTYRHLPYYRVENATQTSFPDSSIKGAALHCAYEMFNGEDDLKFIDEVARILTPGGKVIILPLYMHTHYCAYATADYFGKGYADTSATEYVQHGCFGIPSSRKYDARTLKTRILDRIIAAGMRYQIRALRNKRELGEGIYCHLILEIER